MGYTHYFHQHKQPTEEQWQAICADFSKCLEVFTKGIPIQEEWNDPAPPRVDYRCIRFNGVPPNDHETMYLDRYGHGLQFCKTARKPYDFAVMCLLLLVHHHASDCWEVDSDGGYKEWRRARAWLTQFLKSDPLIIYAIPPKILNKPTY